MGKADDYLMVKMSTPEKVLFEGQALSLSSINAKGDFNMMVDHTNFITVIKDKLILFLDHDQQREFDVDMGILRCFDNNIEVFLGIKVLTDASDV